MPDPNPPEFLMALEKYLFENARGTSYEEPIRRAYMDFSRFFGWIELVEPYLKLNGKKVLDSGCGVGGMMVALAQKGAVPYGIEVSEDLFRMANARLAGFDGAHVELLRSDRLPFDDETFDAVFSLHVVEHVQNLEIYFNEMFRVMKKGGVALMEFPSRFFPIEPHNNLYLIPYLPKSVSNALCRAFAGSGFLGADLSLRLRNAADDSQLANFLTRCAVKKYLVTRARILSESYNKERLLGEAMNTSKPYGRMLSAVPWAFLGHFSWIFQRNITLIFEKS